MGAHRMVRNVGLSLSGVLTLGITAQSKVFAQDTTDLEEITVTGTRILRRDYEALTPIVTLGGESFTERTNIGLEATLNQLPQFNVAGTQSQLSSANSAFPSAIAAPGAATVDLRGLGLNRTLVLLDGRRVQPVNGLLVVDLNTIPSAAIERVEVITGGAAAVYGADAIAGVVNFILKRDFEGMEFSTQYGMNEEGDGDEVLLNGLFGSNFADDRGNVMLGLDYARREVIYGRDRDWVVDGWNDPGTNAGGIGSSNLSTFVVDGGNAPTAGWLPPATNYVIDQNGNVFNSLNPMDPAHPYTGPLGGEGPNFFKLNPDGSLGYVDREHNYLQFPLERYSIFGSGRYDLTDRIEFFSTARFSETFATTQGFVSGAFNVWSPTIPFNSQYDDPNSPTFGQWPEGMARHPVPAQLGALLSSRPNPDAPWTYSGGLDYIPNFRTETTSNVYQIISGIAGEAAIGSREWRWETSVSHGKTTVNARQPEGFPHLPRLQNLFNADMYGQDFDISSLPGYFPLAVTGHCTSGLPLFNLDGSVDNTPSVSKDCADYMVLRMNNITTLTQDIVEASVSGDLVEMWAGDLLFAFGAAYREENFAFDPDSGFNANQDFPNVIQNIILPVSVEGVTDVKELYAEFAIPLVSDRKFVQSFEIDPGIRWSDYNTVGAEDTWKLLFDWTVNDRLRFRGGRQVATRAPNVTELFTPRGGSQIEGNAQDACGSWPATQVWGNVPGNPNRFNLQTLCQHLMVRDGAPPSLYVPGEDSADNWMFNVFGATFNFPFSIGVTEGNPDLQSEEADTFTLGMVLSFDRVTFAVDWYEIDLKQSINTPAFATIYQQCMDPQFNPLIASAPGTYTGAELAAGNPFCALINREYIGNTPQQGATGAARTFDARYMNQGGLTSEGVDVQLDWRFDVGPGGSLNMNIVGSFLDLYAESAFPGAAPVDYTGTTFNDSFDYKVFSTLRYQRGDWSVGMRWQHLPGIDTQPGAATDLRGVNSHDQLDVFGRWSFRDRYELRMGIDNLLDAEPEVVGATSTNNALGSTNSNYDPFGRRFFAGLTISM
ncbi:MAG: TonB-dependent receptor [Gammaproteobacteria bacterium]|nr:TonB-dependent receptor [Gammaproteobacteria bacterium]